MKLIQNSRFTALEDHAKQYVEDRVNALIAEANWDSDTFPEISNLSERLSHLEDVLLSESENTRSVYHFHTTAIMYATELAKAAYMRGILDGGQICHALITGKLPENEKKTH